MGQGKGEEREANLDISRYLEQVFVAFCEGLRALLLYTVSLPLFCGTTSCTRSLGPARRFSGKLSVFLDTEEESLPRKIENTIGGDSPPPACPVYVDVCVSFLSFRGSPALTGYISSWFVRGPAAL